MSGLGIANGVREAEENFKAGRGTRCVSLLVQAVSLLGDVNQKGAMNFPHAQAQMSNVNLFRNCNPGNEYVSPASP